MEKQTAIIWPSAECCNKEGFINAHELGHKCCQCKQKTRKKKKKQSGQQAIFVRPTRIRIYIHFAIV